MLSTGIKGLDQVISGLQLGDNVVWQIDSIESYFDFVDAFVKKALEDKRRLVYIRFANHRPILEKNKNVVVYKLDPLIGFEPFSAQINHIINKEGEGVYYVFDCLSDLLSAWSNDLMIGNFFKITCPFLYELNTVTYFALLRNRHSYKTVARIRDTTQLLIDVYHYDNHCYIHPLKVWNRYSPTMFLPHVRKKDQFITITSSVDSARLFSHLLKKGSESTQRNLDYWDRMFMKAESLVKEKSAAQTIKKKMVDTFCRLIIAREEKLLKLAKTNLTLEDFLSIKSRMIGTGFIGGKSAGMLIARNILQKDKSFEAEKFFEPHDSFYIGSDVFYTYIVENGWWKARMEQRTKEGYFNIAQSLREKLLTGFFPEEIKEQFQQMIEYFGQSPIIVRSSSLLEDSYGNAFAGKYESIFLANQGPPEERYTKFVEAVKRIYASTMNEDALVYRRMRGLDQMDEQMALLVQRVSGAYRKNYFFPDMAGVGISYNTFVWKNTMDPKAGMLRLVLGLGTRAVNRVEGDYPRIVALDEPLLKAHATIGDTQRFSQHYVDVLNAKENALQTIAVRDLLKKEIDMRMDLFGMKDESATSHLQSMGMDGEAWVVTFDHLLAKTPFCRVMQKILKILEAGYQYPVDIEFTVNFKPDGEFQINLLQCRPVQTKGLGKRVEIPKGIPKDKIIFESQGNFLGGNISLGIRHIIYVNPKGYSESQSQSIRYDIARAVGALNRRLSQNEKQSIMLLGPGRWGTSTPSLGVPVSFAEINHVAVLGEIAFVSSDSIPEISFGTHFFQDLVETGIFYLALFPQVRTMQLDSGLIETLPNLLKTLTPEYKKYEQVIKVVDVSEKPVKVIADIVSQKVICFYE